MAQTSLNSTGVASTGALSLQSNGTTEAIGISTGQVATFAQNPVLTSGTANGVGYLNGSKVLTTGSALTFDGTNFTAPRLVASSTDATGSVIQVDTSATAYGQMGGSNSMGWKAGSQHIWNITAGEQMRLTSTGLGIGTSSPGAKLDVNGASRVIQGTAYGYQITNSGAIRSPGNGVLYISADTANAYASSQISFDIDGNILATLDSSGNLGIGTTSPTDSQSFGRALDMRGSTGSAYYSATSDNSTRGFFATFSGGAYVGSETNHPLVFRTNNTERARIDSSGNLLVGTTSGGLSNSNSFALIISGGAYQIYNHVSGISSGTAYAQFGYNGGAIGSITQAGTTGVLYNVTSDYRLKTVIGPVANAGQRIDALQPIEYTWNASGERTRGFLAHKFQEVYAGSVSGTKDAVDAEGKPVYQSMQASSSEVIADLVAEIQSLRKRLAAAGI